jgi:hypothetical protein
VRNDSIAVGMFEISLEQAAVFVASGVALTQQFFAAELVPLLLGPTRANLNRERGARLFSDAAGTFGEFLGGETPSRLGDFQPIGGALDDNAPAQIRMLFEIKPIGHVLGRRVACLYHRVRILERNIEDAHLPRRGDVTGLAALPQRGRLRRHRDRLRIFKMQQTTREIRMKISDQFEDKRLLNALKPDAASHAAARTVVDLAPKNVFMKTPGHALRNRAFAQMS